MDWELSEPDWNFDTVPNEELIPCCLWEYARESEFIRNVRQRCIKSGGDRDERLTFDLNKLHSIGPHVEVLMRGIYFAPDDPHRIDMARNAFVTNSFPAAWQTLPEDEKDFRVRTLLCAGWNPATPFKRADWNDATEIAKRATAEWDRVMGAYHRVRAVDTETSEVDLIAQGKLQPFTEIPVSILREHGVEATTVSIDWANFTNTEIAKCFSAWLKSNRPKTVKLHDGKGTNKDRDWRVALERLGMMRLLHDMTLSEIPAAAPDAWDIYGKCEWYKERTKAREMFRRLFPCLAKSESPLHWPTKGGRSK
jgi:hypothetical protein